MVALLGFDEARTHGPGADGGVDVESPEVVAQVKARVSPAGRPDLQRLFGVAAAKGKQGVFFSHGGFAGQAMGWANEVGLALFAFDLQGEPFPLNAPAYRIAGMDAPRSVPAITTVEPAIEPTSSDPLPSADDDSSLRDEGPSRGSLRSPAPLDWEPVDQKHSFVKYARRLRRNGHRVTGYVVALASDVSDHALVAAWAEAGIFGEYVVVDHDTGRVEGYRTWAEAYAATCEWDGGTLAPSVRASLGSTGPQTED